MLLAGLQEVCKHLAGYIHSEPEQPGDLVGGVASRQRPPGTGAA